MTLVREQLVESLLISLAGGVAGVLLSLAATKWLVSGVDGSSQRARYPCGWDCIALRLRARLCGGAAGGSVACDFLDRQGRDCSAAGFVADHSWQPVAHRDAQDSAYS